MNGMTDPRYKGGTATIEKMIKLFAERGQQQQARDLWETGYQYWLEMRQLPSGVERAKALQAKLDLIILTNKKSNDPYVAKISCKPGCSACCHQEVWITDDEAIQLSRFVKDGLEIDKTLLKAQLPWKDAAEWKTKPKPSRRCVFLNDQENCRIYENRPVACRKHFVLSPPEQCDDINGSAEVYAINHAEAFVSAAFNLKPESGPMAKMLLPRLS